MFGGIPEGLQPITLTPPATTNGGITLDTISLKNALKAWMVVSLTQAAGHATAITPQQCSAVDRTGAKAIPTTRIWANEDVAAGTTLTRQTDAAAHTVGAVVKNMLIVIEIDPAALDHANGFDCIGGTIADSSEATNFADVVLYIDAADKSATTPGTGLVD